jgi:hypothetical protein
MQPDNYRTVTPKRRTLALFLTAGLLVSLVVVLGAASALAGGAQSSKARVSGGITMRSQSFTLSRPDEKRRLTVGCP